MKSFLLKTLGFIAVFVAIATALFSTDRLWGRYEITRPGSVLILGNSHPECSFNDALIPDVVNFAESGEAYFYTYFKGRRLIDRNPSLKRVLIDFSNSAIHDGRDSLIWNDQYLSFRFPTYATLFDAEALDLLLSHNLRGVVENLPFVSKRNVDMLVGGRLDHIPTLGGYRSLDKVMTSPKGMTPYIEGWATENLKYIDRLIAYARARGLEVTFVRTPVHSTEFDPVAEEAFQRLRLERYGDIDFLDFQQFPLADSDFADIGHLNHIGADKFSRWVATLIEEGLFTTPDKQAFIDARLPAQLPAQLQ
jgi:hypothetical protein